MKKWLIKKLDENKDFIILCLLIFFGFLLRLKPLLTGSFPFSFDMGRDFLWTRDIVVLKKPTLIGPWGSLQGIFFGPGWFYLLTIPFLIFNGHPVGGVALCLFFNLLTVLLAFMVGSKIKDRGLGLIFAATLIFSKTMINLSSFAFHANLLPFTTLIITYSLYKLFFTKDKPQLFFLGIAAFATSFNFHLEPATAIFSTLTIFTFILYLVFSQKINFKFKSLMFGLVGFITPFVPQIIFEFRHNFLQTRSLLAYFAGNNESLEGKLPFWQRVGDRFTKFLGFYSETLPFNHPIVKIFIFIVILVVFLSLKKKDNLKKLFIVLFSVLLIPFFGFIFIFPPELKQWYLYGLPVIYSFLLAIGLREVYSKNLIGKVFVSLFLASYLLTLDLGYRLKYFEKTEFFSNFDGEVQAVNYIYQDSSGKPFKVYVFTPPVYEYGYQYLFWWRGRQNGYWPEEYAYLPGKTDYVPNKERYNLLQSQTQGKQETDMIYLIIESKTGKGFDGWYGRFADSKLLEEKKMKTGLIIQKRQATKTDVTIDEDE